MTIATTPTYGLPYPESDEPVTNGWDAIRDLAVAMENLLTTGELEPSVGVAGPTGAGVIAQNTWTTLTLASGITQTKTGDYTLASANTRFTVTRAGTYLVSGQVGWTTNANGQRLARILANSAIALTEAHFRAVDIVESTVVMPPTLWVAAAGDYVTLDAYQNNSGGNLAHQVGTENTRLLVQRVSA